MTLNCFPSEQTLFPVLSGVFFLLLHVENFRVDSGSVVGRRSIYIWVSSWCLSRMNLGGFLVSVFLFRIVWPETTSNMGKLEYYGEKKCLNFFFLSIVCEVIFCILIVLPIFLGVLLLLKCLQLLNN